MTSKTLVFSIALNGYQYLYRPNLRSQETYANRYGFDYIAVQYPGISSLGLESAWLKIVLILKALERGYDRVLYLDADTHVSPTAPNIQGEIEINKYIYLAHGFSGRINSGVIMVTSHDEVIKWLKLLLDKAEQPVPEEDDVGWGENGHVISYTKNSVFLKRLDGKWNNNIDPRMVDYIRHFSAGPMRKHYQSPKSGLALYWIIQIYLKVLRRLPRPSQSFTPALLNLAKEVTTHYSQHFANCE